MERISMSTNQNSRYFQTSSFYAACFLFAKDQTLANIDKVTDPKRSLFVFLDSPEREQLLHNFNFAPENSPEAMIDARKFVTAIKQLKDKLYQENF
jgi:hypothetical protein